jgi:glycerate kinase
MDAKLSMAILELARVHDKRGEEIAVALDRIATQIKNLGNGNAMDGGMGAIENLSVQVKDGLDSLSSAISEVGNALDTK